MMKTKLRTCLQHLLRQGLLLIGMVGLVVYQDFLWQFWSATAAPPARVDYGVTFSYPFAEDFGLDWRQSYLQILEEPGLRYIRLPVYWDQIEPTPQHYRWNILDWQLEQAALANVKVLLNLGHRSPRYPECYSPAWTVEYSDVQFKNAILQTLAATVDHFQQYSIVETWQVENEPFAAHWGLGCRNVTGWLEEELRVVKQSDPMHRPTVLTYFNAPWFLGQHRDVLKLSSDIVGATVFDRMWVAAISVFNQWRTKTSLFNGYVDVLHLGLLSPISLTYQNQLFAQQNKKLWVVELQAEPWGPDPITEMGALEARKSMNPNQLIWLDQFVRSGGISRIYFWGVEWMLAKRQQGDDQMWNTLVSIARNGSQSNSHDQVSP